MSLREYNSLSTIEQLIAADLARAERSVNQSLYALSRFPTSANNEACFADIDKRNELAARVEAAPKAGAK